MNKIVNGVANDYEFDMPFEKQFDVKYDKNGIEHFARWIDPTIKEKDKKIEELKSKIDKAIQYINTHEYPSMYGLRENDLSKKELLDILKGNE